MGRLADLWTAVRPHLDTYSWDGSCTSTLAIYIHARGHFSTPPYLSKRTPGYTIHAFRHSSDIVPAQFLEPSCSLCPTRASRRVPVNPLLARGLRAHELLQVCRHTDHPGPGRTCAHALMLISGTWIVDIAYAFLGHEVTIEHIRPVGNGLGCRCYPRIRHPFNLRLIFRAKIVVPRS